VLENIGGSVFQNFVCVSSGFGYGDTY
jgi:hypothetical protein